MFKPQFEGSKILFNAQLMASNIYHPTAAEIALIDSANTSPALYPNAHTSTLQREFDCRRVSIDDTQALAAGMKVAFGVFLSHDVNIPYVADKSDLIFQLSMAAHVNASAAGILVYPFYGRTQTATITSSWAAQANLLTGHAHLLPEQATSHNGTVIKSSLVDDLFLYNNSSGSDFAHCFGFVIANPTAGSIDIDGLVSITARKYLSNWGFVGSSN